MNAIMPSRTSAPVLTPTTFDQLVTFSEIAATSGMVPKDYIGKPGAIMIAVQMGSELGLSPMQSLTSIAVINGRPGVWGDGLLGLCRQSPLCEDITETMQGEGDDREAICIAKRRGASPVEGRFSVADAKRANLWGKNIWAAYPDRMLRNRARGFALRDAFPDVLRGLRTGEELVDTPADDFRGTTIEAAPAAPQVPSSSLKFPREGTQPLQQAKAAHHDAARAAAVTPPPQRMTVAAFLDRLDKELALAPDADAVEALMRSTRVTEARAFMRNGAADRLAKWTERAEEKRQALRDDEAEAKIEMPATPETTAAPDPWNASMPDDIGAWPLAEEMAGG
jgi:hypothetical protein